MKVWVVLNYDFLTVSGVFSTKKAAFEHMKKEGCVVITEGFAYLDSQSAEYEETDPMFTYSQETVK